MFSCVWLFVTPWTVARQAPLFMEFFRQEYWNWLPFPTPGPLPDSGIELLPLLYWLADSLPLCHLGSPSERGHLNLSVQFNHSVVSDSLWSHGLQHAKLPCPSPTPGAYSRSKLMSIESVMTSNHLILCHPLLLPLSIFPSIRIFSNESVRRIRWP